MKRKRCEDDDTFSCPICLEDYEITGDKLPRIFPCNHTACAKCIPSMIQNADLVCPKCRKKHKVTNGVKSFPQNPYIISTLKVLEKRKEEEFKLCYRHKRELSIYCKGKGCMKPICQLCLLKSHMGHKVVDRIEEHKVKLEVLFKSLLDSKLLENLKCRKNKDSLEALENMKRNSMDKFDRMIQDVKESIASSERINHLVQEELENVLEMKINLDETERANPKDIESVDKLLVEKKKKGSHCCYLKYEPAAFERDSHGELIDSEICLPKSEILSSISLPHDDNPVKCVTLLPNDTVAVVTGKEFVEDNPSDDETNDDKENTSEQENDDNKVKQETRGKLIQYSYSGNKLLESTLDECPDSMTTVSLVDRKCLALSYSIQKKIEFRDVNSLDEVRLSYSVAPHEPGALCTESTGTLLFVDKEKIPLKVRRLDCCTSPPEEIDLVTTIEGTDSIFNILSIECKNQKLIIVERDVATEAYLPDSTELWSIGGSLPGVEGQFDPYGLAADDHGHLLLCDLERDCVRMFSLDDGSYMGVVLSTEQDIERPFDISRCNNKSMYIISSNVDHRLYFVKIETDSVKECAESVKEWPESVSFDDQLAEEQCVG